MEKNAVNWFEIATIDFERAKNFYSGLMDIELMDMNMPGMQLAAFPMVQGGEYSTGAIIKADDREPTDKGTIIYFACDDVNTQLKKVESLGGKVVFPKTSIGENGFIAHVIDTEGNRVALHSVK